MTIASITLGMIIAIIILMFGMAIERHDWIKSCEARGLVRKRMDSWRYVWTDDGEPTP